MKQFFAAAVMAVAVIAPASVLHGQETPPPLSAYGELPGLELATLSPSGKRIAALMNADGQRRILLLDDAMKVLRTIGAGEVKVRNLQWIGDDAVLITSTQTEKLNSDFLDAGARTEVALATIIPVEAGAPTKVIFRNSMDVMSTIHGNYGLRRTADGWKGYFGGFEMTKGIKIGDRVIKYSSPSLYEVDLAKNVPTPIARPGAEGYRRDWLIDADGKVQAIFNFSASTGAWNLTNAAGSTIADGRAPTGQAWIVGFGPQGNTVVYSTYDDARGETVWTEVPLAGGAGREFAPGLGISSNDLLIDPYSDRILGYFSERNGKPHVEFFDKEAEARAKKVVAAFSKLHLTVESFVPDLTKVIARTSGNDDSGTWYLVDTVNLKAGAIGYERLPVAAKVGPISTFDYKASDGTQLDGILTLPRGREAKGLPVVIFPHGGPHAHDRAEFDWWAQAMASRGYAVFQPNFRGSTNRDDAFMRAGFGEWGGKMQTDISDGLAALAAKGIVDPKRACIVGASFGGYAALAGITLQQGLYRCAVAVAPVSDLEDMFNEDTYRGESFFGSRVNKASFLERIGPRAIWDSRSPLRHAGRADAPLLLIHGRDDVVVRYSHSVKMQKAMEAAGKPVTLVTLKEEDHWMSRAPTRQQMLAETVAFLERHNPPQ